MRKPPNLQVGDRVRLIGGHPWAGHLGQVVSLDHIGWLGAVRPKVRLDAGDHVPEGHQVYVLTSLHAERIVGDQP